MVGAAFFGHEKPAIDATQHGKGLKIYPFLTRIKAFSWEEALSLSEKQALSATHMKTGNNIKALVTISDEHAQLVDILQALDDAAGEDPLDVHKVSSVFEKLVEDTARHFAHEEEFMRACDYADYGDHRGDHEKILQQFRTLLASAKDRATASSCMEAKEAIERSLLAHMKRFDDELVMLLSSYAIA